MSDRLLAGRRAELSSAERKQEFLAFRRLQSERQLVDRREAAKLLSVTVRILRRWHEEHRGPPAVLFRRQKFYALPDILEHLGANRSSWRELISRRRTVLSTETGGFGIGPSFFADHPLRPLGYRTDRNILPYRPRNVPSVLILRAMGPIIC